MTEETPPAPEANFRAMVEAHSDLLFRVAYRLIGNRDDADDVVQEAFLKAYRSFDSYVPGSSETAWLCRIASNCALDFLRRRKHRRTEDLEASEKFAPAVSTEARPDRAAYERQVRQRVEAELVRLSDRERTAFVMRHFADQPIRTIAETLDVSIGSVKNNIFRAARKLRAALQPTLGGSR